MNIFTSISPETIQIILWFLVFHFLADYAAQSRRIAKNKSTNLKELTIHVLIYTFVFGVGVIGTLEPFMHGMILIYIILNGVAHWITDFFTSRFSKALYMKSDNPNGDWAFWTMLGFDQLIHLVTVTSTLLIF